jgi:hypothetical protein
MIFLGVMSSKEKDDLINSFHGCDICKELFESLFKKSQKLSLKAKKAILLSWDSESDPVNPIKVALDLKSLYEKNNLKYSDNSDIAIAKIFKVTDENQDGRIKGKWLVPILSRKKNLQVIFLNESSVKKFSDVQVGNDVFMFGYPTSISRDPQLNIMKPLLRKGIVAGKNIDLESIILDCPAFYGNSGGLVIEVEETGMFTNKYRGIGIVTSLIPFQKQWLENSGYSTVVPMDNVEDLIKQMEP